MQIYKLLKQIWERLRGLNMRGQQKVKCPRCNSYNVSPVKSIGTFKVSELEYPTYICRDWISQSCKTVKTCVFK